MTDISGMRLTGVRIGDVSLTDARVGEVDVVRASFWRVRVRDAWIGEMEIDGAVEGLRINGVDVGPLIEAELDRRYPDRVRMRPDDAPGSLRHLVFATDIWVRRAVLGDPTPWHPLSLPFDEMDPDPGVPWDRDARPELDEVLALRADRRATVRRVLDDFTDERLAARTEAVAGPGYPPPDSYPVAECLRTVLAEEWQHRLYAERDLAVLEERASAG